jgi:crotonobetainyl-CoA:carnitine CoA-transferase CaiB-like acyl-CoA transferase
VPKSAALDGVTVLDFTRILAGPYCTMILADLGAEVVKVERPGSGDDTRRFAPPYFADQDGNETSEAAYFHAANRGKKSLTLDLGQPRGQEIARTLAGRADVIVENFKTGDIDKFGLGYDAVRASNPSVVYCSITGFGQTGPYRARAGYDAMIQAMGGIMSVTGQTEGEPLRVGIAISDLLSGLYATIAILAALGHRQRTGEGQSIDIALLDSTIATLSYQATNFLATGENPPRHGNAHPNIVPYQAFPTADGSLVLAVGNDTQFARFCDIAGRPDLAEDPLYASIDGRVRNRAALVPVIAEIMKTRTSAAWSEALESAGIPSGPINTLADVFSDPQVIDRELRIALDHPTLGRAPSVASPLRLSQTPVAYRHAPPVLGQHTDEILGALGLAAGEIAELREAGVI